MVVGCWGRLVAVMGLVVWSSRLRSESREMELAVLSTHLMNERRGMELVA